FCATRRRGGGLCRLRLLRYLREGIGRLLRCRLLRREFCAPGRLPPPFLRALGTLLLLGFGGIGFFAGLLRGRLLDLRRRAAERRRFLRRDRRIRHRRRGDALERWRLGLDGGRRRNFDRGDLRFGCGGWLVCGRRGRWWLGLTDAWCP